MTTGSTKINKAISRYENMAWKYFTEEESFNLVDDLMYKLDRARELYGHAIVITSGFRDPAENALVGGVSESAHTTGHAADVRVPLDREMRERLIWAMGRAGFSRIGIYDAHIHVDVDRSKPSPACWSGISH